MTISKAHICKFILNVVDEAGAGLLHDEEITLEVAVRHDGLDLCMAWKSPEAMVEIERGVNEALQDLPYQKVVGASIAQRGRSGGMRRLILQ